MEQHWTAYGACAGLADDLFVQGAAQRVAREVCAGCVVRLQCLVDALDARVGYGVWGGMTERERRALLRQRPDVVSWRDAIRDDPSLVPPLPRPATGPTRRDGAPEAGEQAGPPRSRYASRAGVAR